MHQYGPASPISSRDNRFVKFLRSLSEPKGRKKEQAYIIEGFKMVEEALRIPGAVSHVIATPTLLRHNAESIIEMAASQSVKLTWITDRILDVVSETRTPQPVIAVVRMKEHTETEILKPDPGLFIIAHWIQDPGNIGTIIRSSEAVGASGVVITHGTVDPYGPKAVRASMGSILRLPIIRIDDLSRFLERCTESGFQTVGLAISGKIAHFELDLTRPTALIVGSEGLGLPEDIMQNVRYISRIPMFKGIDSLNVATAASVVLYEAYRQRFYADR